MKLFLIIAAFLLCSCANTNTALVNRTDSPAEIISENKTSSPMPVSASTIPLDIVLKEYPSGSGYPMAVPIIQSNESSNRITVNRPVTSVKLISKKPPVIKPNPDAILDKLKLAAIAFSVPDIANIHDDIMVQLLIDPSKNETILAKELNSSNNAVVSKVLISKILDAKISAADFDIIKITPERQAIAETVPTEWLWELSATKPGVHDIHLTITAIVEVEGVKAERHIKTFEKVVKIEITNKQIILEFISKYWQWLWTVLLLPIATLIWKKIKK